MEPCYVGLMSGTSVDGIDCVVARFPKQQPPELIHCLELAIPDAITNQAQALSHPGDDEINRLGQLDRDIGLLFADAVNTLLQQANLTPQQVRAIGSHGQTVRHHPPSAIGKHAACFTLQVGDPNIIAEETGITTIADFRRRDMAAGGEGAPLAPAFHAAVFGSPNKTRGIINIGGIANLSVLHGNKLVAGFDTGPGNTLMDLWITRHLGERYDRNGNWAAQGSIDTAVLQQLLAEPYFQRQAPKSTGKELFNLPWLERQLPTHVTLRPEDVQATVLELTAISVANAIHSGELPIEEAFICGGGTHNTALMSRLEALLPGISIGNTSQLGIDPDWVEATAFAWLAAQTVNQQPGNAPSVTGACGERILGAIYTA